MKLGIDDRSLDQYTHEQVNCLNVSHRKDIDSRVLGNREVGGLGLGITIAVATLPQRI